MSIVKNRAEFDGICAVAYAYCKEDPSLIENYEHAKADKVRNSMRSIGKANKGKHWRIVKGQRIWY